MWRRPRRPASTPFSEAQAFGAALAREQSRAAQNGPTGERVLRFFTAIEHAARVDAAPARRGWRVRSGRQTPTESSAPLTKRGRRGRPRPRRFCRLWHPLARDLPRRPGRAGHPVPRRGRRAQDAAPVAGHLRQPWPGVRGAADPAVLQGAAPDRCSSSTEMREELAAHPPRLVVVDPLYLAARGAKSGATLRHGRAPGERPDHRPDLRCGSGHRASLEPNGQRQWTRAVERCRPGRVGPGAGLGGREALHTPTRPPRRPP